jgi:hypothetical protein
VHRFGSWQQADLTRYPDYGRHSVIMGNLILHQFPREELESLGDTWREGGVRALLFNEPARRKRHLFQLPAAVLMGINRVSWHDARVSIRAGFVGDELPRLLGLDQAEWDVSVSMTSLGGYRMRAIRAAY